MKLRPYQSEVLAGVYEVWSLGGCPLVVLPTGSGKTVVFARAIAQHMGAAVAIAHRKELVGQMSRALAREGVVHRIIAPRETIAEIVRSHIKEFGRHFYLAGSPWAVAGVDSIKGADATWCASVSLWVMDEAHHVLRENKWGRALARFTNAKGLGVTATPNRADGRGIGKHADGLFTHIVRGPSMRECIDDGFLSKYKVFSPPNSLDLSSVNVGASGDYAQKALATAVRRAEITGNVVEHYKRHAAGQLGVAFVCDIAAATELADAFNKSGVPALAVSSKTKMGDRVAALERFAARDILVLVNVDLFGEGFDLPAIQVCMMVRPTKSWPLFVQQFGRALRIMPGKEFATIIDHVGNVRPTHGLPDKDCPMTLDSRVRRTKLDPIIKTLTCAECGLTYEATELKCPDCEAVPVPVERSQPHHVSGDLIELSEETLIEMRKAVSVMDEPEDDYRRRNLHHLSAGIVSNNIMGRRQTQDAQAQLRVAMDWWAGHHLSLGNEMRQAYRAFFLEFGVDAMSARTLKTDAAHKLRQRIHDTLPQDVKAQAS